MLSLVLFTAILSFALGWFFGSGSRKMKAFFCCGTSSRKQSKWQEIEHEAERLDLLPTWDTPDNVLMMQAFEWHVPADQGHWRRLDKVLPDLKDIGVDIIWLPPGCKAMSPSTNGYDIYDLYDLGEFDQKGSQATKWGTKEELLALTWTAQKLGVGIYWDAVLNHKAAADYTERFSAVRVDPQQRNISLSRPEEIEGWVGYDFPGRGEKYSSMKYHWYHFSGIDYNAIDHKNAIYRICGPEKDWAHDVSKENGNYDYLMFADLDYSNQEVRQDVLCWGEWIGQQLPLSGMRLDAAKHYSSQFQKDFIKHMKRTVGSNWSFIGEYWKGSPGELLDYLQRMDRELSLFDVPLVYRFSTFSRTEGADLRRIFDETLVKYEPQHAVTFVANHDTQPGQSLEAPITAFFKPLAYALILLRREGQPCIFYGDLYGIQGGPKGPLPPSCGGKLPHLALARKLYAYGEQRDYFDRRNCIGFVRYGNLKHPSGLACVLSNGVASTKRMFVGKQHTGERWTDLLEWNPETVVIDGEGYGVFPVSAMSVSVWVNITADGRDRFRNFDTDIYKY